MEVVESSTTSTSSFARTGSRPGRRDERNRTKWDFDNHVANLMERYSREGSPIEVNFREIVPFGSGVDRATHLVHTYPAKLLLNIPLFLCNNSILSPKGGLVYDPFCGSGTVLVEAILSGRAAFGADANPLARLIAKAKTSPINRIILESALDEILKSISGRVKQAFSPVVDVEKWFLPAIATELSKLLAAIRRTCQGDVLNFMEVCFSACLRQLSLADPRLSVPVRVKGAALTERIKAFEKPVEIFERYARLNIERLQRIRNIAPPIGFGHDARTSHHELAKVPIKADLVITSPPYAGAQKYIRSSSLSVGWLGLAPENKLRKLEALNIGREHFFKAEYDGAAYGNLYGAEKEIERIQAIYPLRAHIAATYILEMEQAARSMVQSLKQGGHLALVIGDNHVCGRPFATSIYIKTIFETLGLSVKLEMVDIIKSRGLMTKRNRAATSIDREHVIIFRKD
ncbi:DNA methyltransferase [Ensifer aridi]|uniref:DNA methyltransferase n=1 Tax=Ensifer aridi TaxID=1708715 RepID=UPI000A118D43|nr:DNA methyltransferase [Ensifer aridi]